MQQGFEICDVNFKMMGKSGSEQVFNTKDRKDVTPAEYRILEEIHGRHNVKVIDFDEKAIASEPAGFTTKGKKKFRPRTHDEEVDRLRSWYGAKVFASVYQEKYPKLPYTFNEARIHTSTPDNVTDITAGQTREDHTEKLTKALEESKKGSDDGEPAAEKKGGKSKDAGGAKGG